MKKLIALLLVICMVVSLGACKKPAQEPGGSQSGGSTGQTDRSTAGTEPAVTPTEGTKPATTPTEATGTTGVSIPDNSNLINPEKFGGKKLQIYGYSSEVYNDLNNMDNSQGSHYIWMVRAAVDEWATLNNVEIEYVGGYDPTAIQNDILKGGKPDLLLYCNDFPIPVLNGITRAFTQEEYNALANTCGTYYLDMLKYKGQSYGVAAPWASGRLFYYNKTLFEKYGVKSPAEYFMEGNWNWDTYEKCVTDMLRDEDGDGLIDTYGSGSTILLCPEIYVRQFDENGKLTSLVRNSEAYKRYLALYHTIYEKKAEGKYMPAYVTVTPRPATSIGDGEWYDFAQIHRVLENGDVIKAIPLPKYTNDSESFYLHDTVYSAILSSCDEPEATLSLIHYILRVGMRYISDYSLALYKCNYEGIRGASEYSAAWKEKFAAIVAQRQAEFDELTDWDQELHQSAMNYILDADVHYINNRYPVMGIDHTQLYKLPPDSALDIIATREEAWIQRYYELYTK